MANKEGLPVGEQILEALGGPEFLSASGAKNLMMADDALSFRVADADKKINLVKIIKYGDADHTMKFFIDNRARKKFKLVDELVHVRSDELSVAFRAVTGLAVKVR